jgi:sRNA-binding carbon storage regulator CsrA
MPTFTRQIGQSFYIGEDVCITVHDRTAYHATLRIFTQDDSVVTYDVDLRPAVLRNGHRCFLVSLLIGERITVGESTVWVRAPESKRGRGSMRAPGLRIGVFAPPSLRVWRSDTQIFSSVAPLPPHRSEAYGAIAE